jgi:hypothetical protein
LKAAITSESYPTNRPNELEAIERHHSNSETYVIWKPLGPPLTVQFMEVLYYTHVNVRDVK